MSYNLALNYALSSSDSSNIKIWLQMDGPLQIGQAIGAMGLTYASLLYTQFNLCCITKEGQLIKVPLNVQ